MQFDSAVRPEDILAKVLDHLFSDLHEECKPNPAIGVDPVLYSFRAVCTRSKSSRARSSEFPGLERLEL